MNKQDLELWTASINTGRLFAQSYGGDWRKHAQEYFLLTKVANDIVDEVRVKHPEAWKAMTKEERAEVSTKAIRTVMDRSAAFKHMEKMGLQ
jgi:hypothetical protein